MRKVLLSILLALVTAPGASNAQFTGTIQLPTGPLLKPAPDFSEWTITIIYPEDQAAKAAGKAPAPGPKGLTMRPRKIVNTKTRDIMRIVTFDISGAETEKWFAAGSQYTKPPGAASWFAASNHESPDNGNAFFTEPLPASGFADLDWINDSAYAGTVQAGGSECLVFTPGGLDPEDYKDPKKQKEKLQEKEKVAYIDADTRLPVALRLGSEVRQFQFSDTPPSEMLALPADLSEQIRKYQDGLTRLLAPPSRPY